MRSLKTNLSLQNGRTTPRNINALKETTHPTYRIRATSIAAKVSEECFRVKVVTNLEIQSQLETKEEKESDLETMSDKVKQRRRQDLHGSNLGS